MSYALTVDGDEMYDFLLSVCVCVSIFFIENKTFNLQIF